MALSQTQVSQLYVAIFGRASEGEGNKAWSGLGLSMAETATKMLETDAANDYFGGELSNQDFIEFIYLNTLGKTLEQDPDGIAGWVQFLNDGMSRGEVAAHLIEAIMLPENDGTPAQQQFINRVEISNYMANNVDKTPSDWKTSTVFTSPAKPEGSLNVTADEASVEAAKKAVDAIVTGTYPGETYKLTGNDDEFVGTAGDDTFNAKLTTINGLTANSLGNGDDLNGGKGVDTLEATLISAYNVAGRPIDITPTTNNIEIVNVDAQISDNNVATGGTADQVILNAKNMNGVDKFSSNTSDADLLIKNILGSKDENGNKYISDKMTIGMEYTGNANTKWDEANLTALFDQDYLTREPNTKYSSILEIRLANAFTNVDVKKPTQGFNTIEITLGSETITVDISSAYEYEESGTYSAYGKIVELIKDKLAAEGGIWSSVEVETIDPRNLIFSDDVVGSDGTQYFQGDAAGTYLPILLTYKGDTENKFAEAVFGSANNVTNGNRVETSLVDANREVEYNTVSINVELEKVGRAADGGALIIGSMNKDYDNEFGKKSGISTTDTVAGFDEFNVVVKGGKQESSSLSALHSTDNTLRKVTIESANGSNANLTIGKSHTVTTAINSSATAAAAFKDVQVMDASKFEGNLTLNAGITDDIVAKYLNNVAEVNFLENTGLKFVNEVALFDYKGGSGDDVLNIFIDQNALKSADGKGNTTKSGTFFGQTENVFKMDINGGAGNDEITVKFDANLVATDAKDSITNISINGGKGNDTIDITSGTTATFVVAFGEGSNGNGHFGHDTIKGFNKGVVAKTDEVQSIDLTGFTAHKGEVIVVTIGDKTTTFTATADMADTAIAAQVELMLETPVTGTPSATQQFDNASATLTGAVLTTLTATGKDVETVKVDIVKSIEKVGTFDRDFDTSHSADATTTEQGGLWHSNALNEGADILDFTAYGANAVIVDRTTDLVSGATTVDGKFIWLEASAHDASVYNVYEATAKAAGITAVDFTATGNATKGAILGSINLDDDGTIFNIDLVASQLLF